MNKNGRILPFFRFGTPPAVLLVWGETVKQTHRKGMNMSNSNDIFGKLGAALGAVAISATLFIGSFANPNATSALSLIA